MAQESDFKKQDLEQRKVALQEEIKAVSRQINSTLSEVDRVRLEKQKEGLFDQLDEVESKLGQFEIVSSQQKLIEILTPIDFNRVVKAYRLSLPDISKIPETTEGLVLRVAGMAIQPDEVQPPLWRFVNFLIKDNSINLDCQQSLKDWAEDQKITLDPVKDVDAKSDAQSKVSEFSLMIKVKLHPPNKYMVSAAIAEDPDPFTLEKLGTETKIDIPTSIIPKYESGYSEEQLSEILGELIAVCGEKYALHDLSVQWFLPIELMSSPVEYWQIPIGRQKPYSGERCKGIIIRSSNRHFSPDYRAVMGEWKKYWERVLKLLKSGASRSLTLLDPIAGKVEIAWNNADVIGCQFIEHDDREKQIDFWDNLLSQGLPIALWSRKPLSSKSKSKKLMQSVTNCDLADLPTSLTGHHKKCLSKMAGTDQPAVQLSLLWDNPYRPFPDIQYESN
jgi:vWA-MoxR associated protein C-terminal domain/Effector-associated domain 9/vWA-MoxR associated protein middle region (VMAP-M) 1